MRDSRVLTPAPVRPNSGRDRDKQAETGLTPVATEGGSVAFAEARLTVEGRKLFRSEMQAAHFLDKAVPEVHVAAPEARRQEDKVHDSAGIRGRADRPGGENLRKNQKKRRFSKKLRYNNKR